jgi:hypothetical protein
MVGGRFHSLIDQWSTRCLDAIVDRGYARDVEPAIRHGPVPSFRPEVAMRRIAPSIVSGLAGLAASVGVLAATAAFAQPVDPKILPKEEEVVKKEDPAQRKEGFSPYLMVGASIALSSNNNFVGQPDGNSMTAGLNLLGRLDYLKGKWDWRNTLKIDEVFTRTPVIDDFVKTVDQLVFESVLYWNVSDVVGPFFSLKLDTPMLNGYDVRPAPVDYKVGEETIATAARRLKLTDGFQPLSLKQALGAFVRPSSDEEIQVDIRAGFGASQTFAEGGLVLVDVAGTNVNLRRLEDVVQAGAVVGVDAKGTLEEGRINYHLRAEVMMPFINADPADRSAVDLTNFDIGAKVGFKLFEWASLNYELKILRQPQLVDAWQIQNNLLLTFNYALIQ